MALAVAALYRGFSATDDSALAAAVARAKRRPIEARLAGFDYFPLGTTRSAAAAADPHITLAAALTLARPENHEPKRSRAIAHLFISQRAEAVATLELLVRDSPENATYWNDLAAARYELGRGSGDMRVVARALSAADESIRLNPKLAAARFNRVLSLRALGLESFAEAEADTLARHERDARWVAEARANGRTESQSLAIRWNATAPALEAALLRGDTATSRKIVDEFPLHARKMGESIALSDWASATLNGKTSDARNALNIAAGIGAALRERNGEHLLWDAVQAIRAAEVQNDRRRIALLANAHAVYTRGRLAVQERAISDAEQALRNASEMFREGDSPMQFVAEYYRAGTLLDLHRHHEVERLLSVLIEAVPEPYRALRAQLLWEQSRLAGRTGRPYDALSLSIAASDAFSSLGETENALQTRSNAVALLTDLGRAPEAWRMRPQLFAEATASGDPRVLERVLNAAANDAVIGGDNDVAASLYDLEIGLPVGSPVYRFDALLWRALVAARTAQQSPDASQLALLRSAADALPDPAFRADAHDKIRFVEALSRGNTAARDAIALLDSTVDYRKTHNSPLIVEALIERARAHSHSGAKTKAIRDYRDALAAIAQQSTEIRDTALRDAFFGTAADTCRELVDAEVTAGLTAAAFETADRCRAPLTDAPPSTSATETVRERAKGDEIVVAYTTTPARTIAFIAQSGRLDTSFVPLGRGVLTRHLAALRSAWQEGQSGEAELAVLQNAFLAPIEARLERAKTVVIVADDLTSNIPFAALKTASNGRRYLTESHRIILVPSVTSLAIPAERNTGVLASVTAIGDPAFDPRRFPWLQRLPHARREADGIERLYPGAVAVTAEDATVQRVKRALETSNVVHIGAHAVLDQGDAWQSALILAPESGSDEGVLYVRDVAKMRLAQRPVVVLAACRTAAAASAGTSLRSFATAFVAAGSRAVIAPLTDVDDERSAHFATLLHGALHRGAAPSDALREAQISMIRSKSPPAMWANFICFSRE